MSAGTSRHSAKQHSKRTLTTLTQQSQQGARTSVVKHSPQVIEEERKQERRKLACRVRGPPAAARGEARCNARPAYPREQSKRNSPAELALRDVDPALSLCVRPHTAAALAPHRDP